MKNMRVVMTNMGCYVNKGDRAILISIVKYLSEKYPFLKILVQGEFSELLEFNSFDAQILNSVTFIHISAHPFTGYLKVILSKIKVRKCSFSNNHLTANLNFQKQKSLYSKFLLSLTTIIDLFLLIFRIPPLVKNIYLKNSDLIISGGGTQLEEAESGKSIIPLFVHNLTPLYLSKLTYKKPTYIVGQTIGPIRTFLGKLLTKFILEKFDGIYVREIHSLNYLKTTLLIKNCNIGMSGDLVFLLYGTSAVNDYKNVKIEFYFNNNRTLGICLRKSKQIDSKVLITIFSQFINYILKNTNFIIYLYPQVIDKMNDFHNDYDLLYVLYKNYEGNKRVVLLDTSDWSIFDCIQFLNGLDFLISMRMHPIIFKVIGESKKHSFIAISHIHKFEGLLDDLKCSNRLISIKELTLECLIEKFSEVSKNEKILCKELDFVKQRISEVIDNIIIENYNKKFNLM